MEPSAFAAQLIARLEKLKREQDTMSSLEERLQQIQEVRTRTGPLPHFHLEIQTYVQVRSGSALHYKSLEHVEEKRNDRGI